ncbi:MAG: SH3 domain-containing protein [Tannerella sp.]|jgi:hypothetical protein|nr:SH3 domain-containing protein [Tannerella sp.]
MKPVKTSFILWLALLSTALQAQTENDLKLLDACKEEVSAINSMTLYKKQYIWGPVRENVGNLTIVDYRDIVMESSMIFYDAEKRIRKYIKTFNDPEGSGFSIYWFDADGYEVHSVFHIPWDRAGNQYAKKGKPVYLNMETINENYEIEEIIEQYGGETYVFHADSIKNRLYEPLKLDPGVDPKVTFSPPQAGDKTVTNVRRANVRKAPATDAERIKVIGLGSIVQILERAGDQWYRINLNGETGYIFGELLEPVEREVKKETEKLTSNH